MSVPSASSSLSVQLFLDPDIVMMPYACFITRGGCASSVSDVKHPGRNVVNEFAKSTMWVHHARCTGHANAAPPRRATSARPATLQIGFVCRRARPSGVNLHKPLAIASYGTACRLPRPRVQPSSQFGADMTSVLVPSPSFDPRALAMPCMRDVGHSGLCSTRRADRLLQHQHHLFFNGWSRPRRCLCIIVVASGLS